MARRPRLVLPGIPHHVTQRGNRRERTFFEDGDYELYLDLLAETATRSQVAIWSYCLMPNHVHIVAVPSDEDGLRWTFRNVNRHYTGYINARLRVTGHLWQGRFSSVAMDEAHLVTALRYVALNPVRARLVARADDWPWSATSHRTLWRRTCSRARATCAGLARAATKPANSLRVIRLSCFCSFWCMAARLEVSGAFVGPEDVDEPADQVPQAVNSSLAHFAEHSL